RGVRTPRSASSVDSRRRLSHRPEERSTPVVNDQPYRPTVNGQRSTVDWDCPFFVDTSKRQETARLGRSHVSEEIQQGVQARGGSAPRDEREEPEPDRPRARRPWQRVVGLEAEGRGREENGTDDFRARGAREASSRARPRAHGERVPKKS